MIEPMMSLPLLDLALRAATIALLLVLAGALLRDFRHVTAGRLAAAFALGSAAHAATYAIGGPVPATPWQAPIIALSTGNIVVFWLFTRALFDDAFQLRWWHAGVWLAVVAFSFVNCAFLVRNGAVWTGVLHVTGRKKFVMTNLKLYAGSNGILQ